MEIRQASDSVAIYSDGQRLQVIHNEGKMNKPQIARVDRDMYESGRRLPHLWPIGNELKFYRVACNWGVNRCTQHFYHVLAYSWEHAKDMAISEYARTHYISKDWVKVY